MAPRKNAVAKRARQKSECKSTDKEDRSRREPSGAGALVCCTPRGCGEGGAVTLGQDGLVRMVCTNTKCDQGNLMHKGCFEAYEEYVIKRLMKSRGGRIRCSDAQLRQGLWGKSWNITSKISVCNCGGHLRKDREWEPVEEAEPQAPVAKAVKKKSTEKPSLVGFSNRRSKKAQSSMRVLELNKNLKAGVKKGEEPVQTDQSCPPTQSCDQSSESEADDDDGEPSAPLGYLGCSNIPSFLPVDEHLDFGHENYNMQSYYQQAASSSNSSPLPTSTDHWNSETCHSNNHPTSPDSEVPNALVECFAEWWVNDGWRECALYMAQQGLNTQHLISAHELEMTLELTSDPAIPVAEQLEPWLQEEGWQGFVQHYIERVEVTDLVGSEFDW
ncbi:HECA [Branchiostoma lanceolatum]|uniref:HECA protein n=1 Tax=Branchiostoma lanceolatum TaxID=7740 RepID=A0A8K0EGD5_BRALA|nr:HECA [Branchiostoma lanceolatum]